MSFNPNQITFFERFEHDILNGRKTITIRDEKEKNYLIGSKVAVLTNETNRLFATIEILDVSPIQFEQLNNYHAYQENMTLTELQHIIQEIYPNQTALYVLSFKVVETQ